MNICDKIIKLIKNKEKHASGKMGLEGGKIHFKYC